jgi:dTDP-glucose 4,6-dehydratase
MQPTILVTGGAGFIGANFVYAWLSRHNGTLVNLDKLTYAGNPANLHALQADPRHVFVRGDICDRELVGQLLARFRPRYIVHFAAESHVDRSIHSPDAFVKTNVDGVFSLLEAALHHWKQLPQPEAEGFRFLQVSTDEVYGSLSAEEPAFSETTPYRPNSPYAASKAAGDHLVRAYHRTYGLPVLTTNCSNNYGPYQHPEKLIPLMLLSALAGKALPVYGDGANIRDWLFVEDHCRAIERVLDAGTPGQTYNVGGHNEKTNLEVVRTLCAILDQERPRPGSGSYREQIRFVADRPGHDRRYAVDAGKIERELGWKPLESFESGIRKSVHWYLSQHRDWVEQVLSGEYKEWFAINYRGRTA